MIVKAENNQADLEKLGNKGKFLLMMKKEGFQVPDAFVLDSDIYDETLEMGGIASGIEEALQALDKDNVKETADKIGALFEGLTLPKAVLQELPRLVKKDRLYAVRSSGTKEDLDEFSFAGQYSTFLNTPAEQIGEKVILCYQSMFSEVILSYLVNRSIDLQDLKMSVVVQEMVDADLSGICFTVDPISGHDKTMLMEVSRGLGENLVSGKTIPDRYYYNWYEQKEVRRNADNKLVSEEQVQQIASVFAGIQQYFGYPCDIEFAMKDEKLYILQSRRITKLGYEGI